MDREYSGSEGLAIVARQETTLRISCVLAMLDAFFGKHSPTPTPDLLRDVQSDMFHDPGKVHESDI